MKTILYFFIVAIGLNGYVHAQNLYVPKNAAEYRNLTESKVFCDAQEKMLERIEAEVPNLTYAVIGCRYQFNLSFGKAIQRMGQFIEENLTQEQKESYKEKLSIQVDGLLANIVMNAEFANSFIELVNERAKGKNMPENILQTLLVYQFFDQPAKEIQEGFSYIFSTKNLPKAKNADIQFRLPISWVAEEANRPNIVKNFNYIGEKGVAYMSFMVRNMEVAVTSEDAKVFFNDKETVTKIIPKGATLISYKPIFIDRQPGAMVEFEHVSQLLDVEIKSRIVQYIFTFGNQMYFLTGSVAGEKDENLTEKYQKYSPVFRSTAVSIVLNNQWR